LAKQAGSFALIGNEVEKLVIIKKYFLSSYSLALAVGSSKLAVLHGGLAIA
jgi:hypothetical protein